MDTTGISPGKLDTCLYFETDEDRSEHPRVVHYDINIAGSHNSCVIKISNQKLKVLVDTGEEVSLISKDLHNKFKEKGESSDELALQSVSGENLTVHRATKLPFVIGVVALTHQFYIVSNINRNIILGNDWLDANGVRTYHDLEKIRIRKAYVNLERDRQMKSIIRANQTTILQPNTTSVAMAKVKGPAYF